jgi:hypothetical protein
MFKLVKWIARKRAQTALGAPLETAPRLGAGGQALGQLLIRKTPAAAGAQDFPVGRILDRPRSRLSAGFGGINSSRCDGHLSAKPTQRHAPPASALAALATRPDPAALARLRGHGLAHFFGLLRGEAQRRQQRAWRRGVPGMARADGDAAVHHEMPAGDEG